MVVLAALAAASDLGGRGLDLRAFCRADAQPDGGSPGTLLRLAAFNVLAHKPEGVVLAFERYMVGCGRRACPEINRRRRGVLPSGSSLRPLQQRWVFTAPGST